MKLKFLPLLPIALLIQNAYADIDVGSGTGTIVETDYIFKTNQPFSFSRYYNHLYKFWKFDFENDIEYSNYNGIEVISILKSDFNNTVFKKINNEWVNTNPKSRIKINIDSQNNIVIIRNNGDKEFYKNLNGEFNAATVFSLQRIEKKNGQFLSFEKEALKTIITDSENNKYTILYKFCSESKVVDKFIGIGDKTTEYSYKVAPYCDLEKVIYPDNSFMKYVYSTGNASISEVYDENNSLYKKINYLTYSGTYQPGNKAISEGLGNSGAIDKLILNYSVANKVTATDALNNSISINTNKDDGWFKISGYSSICTFCNGLQGSNITYDSNGFIDTLTDFKGNLSKYSWGANGNMTKLIEAYGTSSQRETKYNYDNEDIFINSKKEQVYGGDKTTEYTYVNNLISKIKVTAPSNIGDNSMLTKEYSFIYDGTKIIEVRNPLYAENNNQKILFTYNVRGQIETITNELGQVTTYNSYDDYGSPTQVVLPNGNVYLFSYDLRGRMLSSTFKASLLSLDEEKMEFVYDLAGQVIKMIKPSGAFYKFTYDSAHRITSIEDWIKNEGLSETYLGKSDFTLDNMSNVKSVKIYDASNTLIRSSTNTYDNKNRLFQTIGSLNQTTSYTYDNNSNLMQIKDADNYIFSKNYDALNRVISLNSPDNSSILVEYNKDDSISSVTDAKGLVTTYKYDGFGNVIEKFSPDTGITKYTYDLKDNLKTKVDAKNQLTTYNYDLLNRLLSVNYTNSSENILVSYDSCMLGKLCSIQDQFGITNYQYNPRGLLSNKQMIYTINNKTFNKSLSYEYDNARNIVSVTYPSGSKVLYGYKNEKIVSVKYKDVNNLSKDIISNVEYLPFEEDSKSFVWGNLTDNNISSGIDGEITQISNSQVGYNKVYGYDRRFNITSINDNNNAANGNSTQISYDSKSRVSSFTHTENNGGNPQSQNFTYGYNTSEDRFSQTSPLGSVTYNYDINSHKLLNLTGAVNKTFSYDVMGNLISDNLNNFIYNSANRLSQSTSIQYGKTQYSYNGYGQRVNKQRVKNGKIHNNWFIYNGTDLMYEDIQLDNNAPLEVEYIYFNGEIIALVQNNVIYYVQTDHLGTPRVIVNSENNNVVWNWENKEPFGDNSPVENGLTFNLRFSGQYYDEEKENSYNIQRDYSSALGRYIQSDPIGLNGGINTYSYVDGNPLSFIDSEGLAVDINMFGWDEDPLYSGAQNYPNDPNRFSIGGHGGKLVGIVNTEIFNKLRFRKAQINYSPEMLARLIKRHRKYKPGMPVDLLGCNTGEITNENEQFAQKLANILKAPVRGPDNYLWFEESGKLSIYGIKNVGGKDVQDLNKKGKYNDFYPK